MIVFAPDLDHKRIIRQLVLSQCIVGIILMLIVAMIFTLMFALALCYGIMIVILSGMTLQRSIEEATNADPDSGKKLLLKSAAIRFIIVLALLFLAYALGLHLLWVAAGFFVGQLIAYVYFAQVFYQQQKQSI